MMYYYKERYLLPFSHDETVHGKATIVQKMFGEYEQKFPQARALYLYMYTHSRSCPSSLPTKPVFGEKMPKNVKIPIPIIKIPNP